MVGREMTKSILALGISLIAFGVMIIHTPKFKRPFYAGYFDFTGFSVPLGVVLIIVGGVCLWISVPKKGRNVSPSYLICPKCQAVCQAGDVRASECSVCRVELEDLKGFYKRHPDRKSSE
jgi:hypothetical protein